MNKAARTRTPPGTTKYSAPLRIWHWLNLIVLGGSLSTVLINATITKESEIIPFLKNEFKNAGASPNNDSIESVAHALGDRVWSVHIYFGYFLSGLFALRILLEFFQLADQKFLRTMKKAVQQSRKPAKNPYYDIIVKSTYLFFYVLLLTMVVTGLILAFEDVEAFKAIRHSVRSIHGFCMYLILAFIVVHLVGVLWAEWNKKPGIVSEMINGGSESPASDK